MMWTSSCIDQMRLKDTTFLVSRDEGFAPFPFATFLVIRGFYDSLPNFMII
jgi:hypothetical protein